MKMCCQIILQHQTVGYSTAVPIKSIVEKSYIIILSLHEAYEKKQRSMPVVESDQRQAL